MVAEDVHASIAMKPLVARIQNVVIPTQEFNRTVWFYRDVLGLPVYRQGEGFCFLKTDGVYIAIHKASGENEFAPTGHGIYLDLIVEDIDETKAHLLNGNIAIRKEWEDRNGRFLLISDPSGNLLELYKPRSA